MGVALFGDTSRRTNWGCRATTSGLHALLEAHGDLQVSLDLKDCWPPSGPVARIARRLGRPRPRPEISAATLDELVTSIADGRWSEEVSRAIEAADVVIVSGEGGVMGRKWAGRLSLLLAAASVRAGRPTALVNHTADLADPALAALAAEVYPQLDDVVVREAPSLAAVAPLRRDRPLALAADAALVHRRDVPTGEHICLGGSAAFNVPGRPVAALVEEYATLAQHISELGPVVITVASRPDDEILLPVAERLGLPVRGLDTTVDEAFDVLGSARLYVGGRWHPGLMALGGGTPVVALGSNSSHKAQGLVEISGLDVGPFSAMGLASEVGSVMEAARRLVADDEVRARIRGRMAAFEPTVVDNVRLLAGSG